MKTIPILVGLLLAVRAALAQFPTTSTPPAPPAAGSVSPALVWDAESKTIQAKLGAANGIIIFWVTNMTAAEININAVRPSCGCTTAKLPTLPWRLSPGGSGSIEASIDLRNKTGTLSKTLSVDTSAGLKVLRFDVTIGADQTTSTPVDLGRQKALELAQADRRAVFKNSDCAACHAEPAQGKTGVALYAAACAICHEAEHRASMVPDLRALADATNPEYWRAWITSGRPGSLMPAFARSQGGPLNAEQIESLVAYLSQSVPNQPRATTPAL